MHLVNGTGNSPSPGQPTPGVVKQDQSSGGSVDTTKTRSGPQRVRMSSGERPIGAAKGKQSDTEALCQNPPPPPSSNEVLQAPPPPLQPPEYSRPPSLDAPHPTPPHDPPSDVPPPPPPLPQAHTPYDVGSLHVPLCALLSDHAPRRVVHVSSSPAAARRLARRAARQMAVPGFLYPQPSNQLVECLPYGPWEVDEVTRMVFTTDLVVLQVWPPRGPGRGCACDPRAPAQPKPRTCERYHFRASRRAAPRALKQSVPVGWPAKCHFGTIWVYRGGHPGLAHNFKRTSPPHF